MQTTRRLKTSLLYGLEAWTAYAALECLLAYTLTIAAGKFGIFPDWAWRQFSVYLGFYAAGGLATGIIAALVPWDGRTVASLSLACAFALNLATSLPLARSEYFALAAALGLVLLLVPGRVPANPWLVSLLLLVFPWVSREMLDERSGAVKMSASLGAFAAVALFTAWYGRRTAGTPVPSRGLLVAAAVLTVQMGGLWAHARRLPSIPSASAGVQRNRPNLLLVSMDTVRADHLSVYGYSRDTTPNLKALAHDASVFPRAFAASDQTLPTHASIFTGMYPSWHRAIYAPPEHPFGRPLDRHLPTLAEILSRSGYATAAVAGNYAYFQGDFGLTRGFSAAWAPRPVLISAPQRAASTETTAERPFYIREGVRRLLARFTCVSDFDRLTLIGGEVTSAAFRLMERFPKEQPYFLFINYIDAHVPYVPSEPYDSKFPGKDPGFSRSAYERLKLEVLNRKRGVTKRERDHLISQYDGAIAYIDAQIGALIARLKRDGVYEKTMIVVLGDHGEAFGEKNLMEHSVVSVYQNQVNVPLIIKYPGRPAPTTIDVPVSQVDVMPTVLATLGLALPPNLQGRNLASGESGQRFVVSEVFPTIVHGWNRSFTHLKRAVVQGHRKLIAFDNGVTELYDLERDPQERDNLAAGGPAPEAQMAALHDWLRAIPIRPRMSGTAVKSLEALKSLGYAQ